MHPLLDRSSASPHAGIGPLKAKIRWTAVAGDRRATARLTAAAAHLSPAGEAG
jgi:hypothetical protein